MIKKFINLFNISHEQEDIDTICSTIKSGVEFRGTNLWILVCAIFIASLGLNVNSTAVIIGAMLISPLMGPIMGMGLGLGTADIPLYRKSVTNFLVATLVALFTSTLYFWISPLNDAHSEILARTQPNIYDVLIAFFGGIAGIIATSSKQKGNVITGVAIATALMPPLCTAGFGLATGHYSYFFGAFYLFTINTVFIALATLLTVKALRIPEVTNLDKKNKFKMKVGISVVILITLLPSIYFGYELVKNDRMKNKANNFIEKEGQIPNEYLLKSQVDIPNHTVSLTYIGQKISDTIYNGLIKKFIAYGFDTSKYKLEVHQGFQYAYEELKEHDDVLKNPNTEIERLNFVVDSLQRYNLISPQLFKEINALYPNIYEFSIESSLLISDSTQKNIPVCYIESKPLLSQSDKAKIKQYIMTRLGLNELYILDNSKKE